MNSKACGEKADGLKTPEFDSEWLAALQAQASRAPRTPRLKLVLEGEDIGSVQDDVMLALLERHHDLRRDLVRQQAKHHPPQWHVRGPATQNLNRTAAALRDAGLAGVRQQWRDEQLEVCATHGAVLGTVERGAVRALGIATRAVHLIGYAQDGRMWVQQRALGKANDPGLWDTLVGGMVPAGESVEQALQRETLEEAGLDIRQLCRLRRGGEATFRKPDSASGGSGYMVERIDWFACSVPAGTLPCNLDGEVAQFACLAMDELRSGLQDGQFTVEAAVLIVASLQAG